MRDHSRLPAPTCWCALVGMSALLLADVAEAKNDTWISTKTKLALMTGNHLRHANILVDVVGGELTIFGTVGSEDDKMLAEVVARGVQGVRQVRNLLKVEPSAAEGESAAGESELRAQVQAALRAERLPAPTKIQVKQVEGATVVLAGVAPSLNAQLRAVLAARSVAGVQYVVSQVRARPRLDLSKPEGGRLTLDTDLALTEAVKLRLAAESQLPIRDVFVDTRGATVTLFGTVPTPLVKTAIEALVRSVAQVAEVKNELALAGEWKDEPARSDAELGAIVRRALRGFPELRGVRATVRRQGIVLIGRVPSRWERLQAVLVARRAVGEMPVRDTLVVGKGRSGRGMRKQAAHTHSGTTQTVLEL